MFYTASTLGQLKHAVDSMIEIMGEDAPVGAKEIDSETGVEFIDYVFIEWVMVNKDTDIVGTEAYDYVKKEGELDAVAVH